MPGISNLGVVTDGSGSTYASGIKAFTSTANYLISVIATNTTENDANIYIYVIPNGSINYADQTKWASIAHNLPLPANNSYETFRFGVNETDEVYVAGSAGIKYFIQGINQG